MAEHSNIEWTDTTWNPILGCDKISPGCKGCYAIRTAWRLQHNPNPKVAKAFEGLTVMQGGQTNWTGRVNFVEDRLDAPLHWKQPRRIFVNSQSDLFHEGVTEEQIELIFAVMAIAPQHTFQILTKRPQRMLSFLQKNSTGGRIFHLAGNMGTPQSGSWPLPNVWLGVSCENQATANERIPLLLQTPAAVRWVSAEPLLGPISFRWAAWDKHQPHPRRAKQLPDVERNGKTLAGSVDHLDGARMLDWAVIGGESGPNARPMHPDWARSLRDQCQAAGVPFFFKQWGEWLPSDKPFVSADSELGQAGIKTPTFAFISNDGPPPAKLKDKHIRDAMIGRNGQGFYKVGKKAAGRLLDGKEHNEYPSAG